MFGLSPVELIVIGSIAVLLFGSRLPNVARSMGKSVTEFKKGLRGIEEELDVSSSNGRRVTSSYVEDREEASVPKFEPPTSEPQDEPQDEAVKSAS
jgi:sec-independent protein translocase protein TatA